jgi:hypothetical protein
MSYLVNGQNIIKLKDATKSDKYLKCWTNFKWGFFKSTQGGKKSSIENVFGNERFLSLNEKLHSFNNVILYS